ncbi:MAG: neutral zinc metallopeptidase [Deltaproteobacteria bacterium]
MLKGRIACWALSLSACSLDRGTFDRPLAEPAGRSSTASAAAAATDAALEAFIGRVVKDVDQSWASDFQRRNKPYVAAQAVAFSTQAPSSCAGIGARDPKCQDQQAVYIDLDFQRALLARFGKEAGPPQAYAIAHAMGHHVQRVLGMDREASRLLASKPIAAHAVKLQLELQADCFAGVWTRVTKQRGLLEREQVEQALRQASEVGTERQLAADGDQQSVETFTYAIPRRRLYWFAKGFTTAKVEDCDTFSTE